MREDIRDTTERGRAAVLRCVASVLLALAGLLLPYLGVRNAEALGGGALPKHYMLTGVIGLEYERLWGTDLDSSSFTQSYSLGIRGPIVDPRLAIFDITGDFIDRSGNASYKTKGLAVELRLLNDSREITNPKYRFINYLPKPVILRYSYYTGDDYSTTNYSASMSYYLPIYFHFFSDGKFVNVRNVNELPNRLKFNQQTNNVNSRNSNRNVNSDGKGNDNGNGNGDGNGNRDGKGNDNGNGNGDGNGNDSENNYNQNQNRNQSQKRSQNQNVYVGPPGLIVPFPFLDFDFDKTVYESNSQRTDTTQFDSRARFTGRNYRYSIEYNSSTTDSSTTDSKENNGNGFERRLIAETWNAIGGFEVQNSIEKNSSDVTSAFRVNSRATSRIVKGPDTNYYINIGGSYDDTEGNRTYSLDGSGSMERKITPALLSMSTAAAIYQHGNILRAEPFVPPDPFRNTLLNKTASSDYSLTLSENLSYTGIRNMALTGGATIGISKGGLPHGLFAGFSASPLSRLSVNGDYSYQVTYTSDENSWRTSTRDARLGAVVYLTSGLNVELRGDHQIGSVNDTVSYDVTYDRADFRLNWYYGRHSLLLTSYVARSENTNPVLTGAAGKSSSYGYSALYNTAIRRNLGLSLAYNYDKDKELPMKRSEFDSRVVWYYGKLSFTAEYRYLNTNQMGVDINEHRLYLTLKRYFGKRF